jgi:phospholipid-binding lipoprotein MlaA
LHNVFENLAVPRTAVNQVLQGRPHEGMVDVTRFAVNSTFGLLGWFDLATRSGLPKREEDFGQTFSVWGIGSGPFVMLPALGPSTVTDTAGTVLDFLFNPIELFESDATQYGLRAVDVIDTRAELMTVESVISGDRYLFMRDAYLQLRAFEVKNGEIDVEDDPFLDDFEDEEEY